MNLFAFINSYLKSLPKTDILIMVGVEGKNHKLTSNVLKARFIPSDAICQPFTPPPILGCSGLDPKLRFL